MRVNTYEIMFNFLVKLFQIERINNVFYLYLCISYIFRYFQLRYLQVLPDGPRLRDRLSHGEVDINQFFSPLKRDQVGSSSNLDSVAAASHVVVILLLSVTVKTSTFRSVHSSSLCVVVVPVF